MFKQFWFIWRHVPYIHVQRVGQRTQNPRLSVSLHSRKGTMTLRTFPDTVAGRAEGKMMYNTLRHITCMPVWVEPGLLRQMDECPHGFIDWDSCNVCNH